SGKINGDSAGLGGRPVRIPINLGPTTRPRAESERRNDPVVRLGLWEYTASRNPNPRDSVPWLLHAHPIGPDAGSYRPEGSLSPQAQIQSVPIVKLPPILWKTWFDRTMQDVVGIHYHEFVTDDFTRVLITIHKLPADSTDGKPADLPQPQGTRLEATLLTPLTFSVDQAIVVRADRRNEAAVNDRVEYERGHGEQSLIVLLDTLAGPQTWDAAANTGR